MSVDYIDIPGRALRYLTLHHPSAPEDPDRYSSLAVCMNRETGPSIAVDGWWQVEVTAGWWTTDGDVFVSVELPLHKLLSDEYAILSEFTEPLW